MYGEIVIFENGQKAMVQDVREDEVGCILFDDEEEIEEGTKVVRSGRMAGIPVGDEFIGRVVNADINLASVDTGAGADVDEVVGGPHGVLVMLHHDQAVAQVPEVL